MQESRLQRLPGLIIAAAAALLALPPSALESACCYFSAKDKDIQQPSQKVFITWDPSKQLETFTVQPRFAGNAKDFGMVIPTPSKPKLDEMPRDFFKELAVFTILKNREYPESKLLPARGGLGMGIGGMGGMGGGGFGGMGGGRLGGAQMLPRPPAIKVVETGVVGSLDYKIINAARADDLFTWLKDHDYHYSGDEATLDFYVKKKWYFTVMKIDTIQMKRNRDGTFSGEVTPTRFQFTSAKLVYPLKITQLSVKEKTEALFYVQAPYKMDLPDDFTYQFQWVPMLQNAQGWYKKGIFGPNDWLRAIKAQTPDLLKKGDELGFTFASKQRPKPTDEGRIATTLEWAKRLTARDIRVLAAQAPFTERVPDVDAGFTPLDFQVPRRAQLASKIIEQRLAMSRTLRPGGYLVREAPPDDVRQLRILLGHLQENQFLTKFRKTFTKDEMDDDLLVIPARLDKAEDRSEYEEILPTSPP